LQDKLVAFILHLSDLSLFLSLTLDIYFLLDMFLHHEIHFYTLAAVTFEIVTIYTTLMQLL